jgi:hypothetical protein
MPLSDSQPQVLSSQLQGEMPSVRTLERPSAPAEDVPAAPPHISSARAALFGGSRAVFSEIDGTTKRTLFSWLILVGVALRLVEYFHNRSIWWDEAMLALNVLHRTSGQLWRPLDYDQGAPIGFLLLERAAVDTLGQSELALRLVPLAAGIASVFFSITSPAAF